MTQFQETTPRSILIAPYPFHSSVASSLARQLNEEVESMYPDWESLPHPGIVPEFRLVSDPDLVPEINANGTLPSPVSRPHVPNALDDNADLEAGKDTCLQRSHSSTTAVPTSLTPEQIKKLYLLVAFDVTDTEVDLTRHASISPLSEIAPFEPPGVPIGCVVLRLLPYFPYHRAPPEIPTMEPDPLPERAELKRVYVAHSHRGPQNAIFTTPYENGVTTASMTVSEVLFRTVAMFARKELFVKKLLLEVGVRQRAAVKFYERLGWKQCPVFGDYVGASEADGGISRCYEFAL